MTWRPIIMSGASSLAIIRGQKTQTRRTVTPSTAESVVPAKLWSGFDFGSDRCFVDPGPSPVGNPGPYLNSGWDQLNAARGAWRSNPWVIVSTFKLLDMAGDVAESWAEYAA